MRVINTKNRVFAFFIISFLISWIFWSPLYFSESISEFWALPGAWGPTLAALIVVYLQDGRSGLHDLLKKVKIWRVGWFTYLLAFLGFFFLGLIALVGFRLSGGLVDFSEIWSSMGIETDDWLLGLGLFPVFYIINTLLGGPIAEELGWRGLAQPELERWFTPWLSGLIIGFIWSLWHLPLMIFLPQGTGNTPFYIYIPMMTGIGVIFAWFYHLTRGSVLLAILLHGGLNFSNFLLGEMMAPNNAKLFELLVISLVAVTLVLKNQKSIPKNASISSRLDHYKNLPTSKP